MELVVEIPRRMRRDIIYDLCHGGARISQLKMNPYTIK
jgi:hypothetical protein